jgi:hypothetical protein
MRSLLFAFAVLSVGMPGGVATCQISPVTETVARELIDVMVREGGQEAASELAQMGGETAVRDLLERAAGEGGEELVGRVRRYGMRYGPSALKAVERSPARMIRALDGLSPDLVGPAIRAAAREPEITDRLVAIYGKEALALEASQPGVGAMLAEKLGSEGITIGEKLTTDQAVALTRYADDVAALPAGERNQLLDAMVKAPAAALDYLETHPKVLLTAGGVAAVIAVKDNLLGGTGSSRNHETPSPGLFERIILGVADRVARPIIVLVVLIIGGIVCCLAIQLRSAWKRKALRLHRGKDKQTVADHWHRR